MKKFYLIIFNKLFRSLFLLYFLILPALSLADPSDACLQLIEIKQRDHQIVFILTLKNNAHPNFFVLTQPDRLVIDLPNTKASLALPKEISSNGFIKKIRLGKGPQGENNLRLVLDLIKSANYIYLDDSNDKKNLQTITVILTPEKSSLTSDQLAETEAPQEPLDLASLSQQSSSPSSVGTQQTNHMVHLATGKENMLKPSDSSMNRLTPIKSTPLKKVVVMLDPGHGGKDTGAIGPNHTLEKNVVLNIAKKLQADLNQMPGIDARLTRHGDYFIPLRNRLEIARANHAQLFLAVHADAYYNASACGASVFILSAHGASSEAARWLANRENDSELAGIEFKIKDQVLKSILLDMSQTSTGKSNVILGNSLLNSLKTCAILHANRVEKAGFLVLKSPDIPSSLIETGFISNYKEENLLTSPGYQAKLADALSQGVLDYLKKNPPPSSWFEMNYQT